MPFWAATSFAESTRQWSSTHRVLETLRTLRPVKTGSVIWSLSHRNNIHKDSSDFSLLQQHRNSNWKWCILNNNGKQVVTSLIYLVRLAQVTATYWEQYRSTSICSDEMLQKWSITMLVGILSVCVMPWKLVTADSAAGYPFHKGILRIPRTPIFNAMVVDYYFMCVRARVISIARQAGSLSRESTGQL